MARLSLVRSISPLEVAVLTRMLDQCATPAASPAFRESLATLSVVARCNCGCDTVDFAGINWADPPSVVADGKGTTETGEEVGVIVFGKDSRVVCLEVYNHGDKPARLPTVESIHV